MRQVHRGGHVFGKVRDFGQRNGSSRCSLVVLQRDPYPESVASGGYGFLRPSFRREDGAGCVLLHRGLPAVVGCEQQKMRRERARAVVAIQPLPSEGGVIACVGLGELEEHAGLFADHGIPLDGAGEPPRAKHLLVQNDLFYADMYGIKAQMGGAYKAAKAAGAMTGHIPTDNVYNVENGYLSSGKSALCR